MTYEKRLAAAIVAGFEAYWLNFYRITTGARERFVDADWHGIQAASELRTQLYNEVKDEVCRGLAGISADWSKVRLALLEAVQGRPDGPLISTFYNSVYRKLNARADLDDERAFILAGPEAGPPDRPVPISVSTALNLDSLFQRALRDCELGDVLQDLERDSGRIAERLLSRMPELAESSELQLELLQSVFYRNKGAYLIGRLKSAQGQLPIAISLGHRKEGIVVDAVLWGEDRLSVLFSFTRSYFMVDYEDPEQLVEYLGLLLPAKKYWELLTSIGFFKHGKTEFVRGYRAHLEVSDDQFVLAEGIKGQVMVVFCLASYQVVFKVIKDRFPATKTVNRDDVLNAYQLVKAHDRVGRMADTQEFHEFAFPLHRFADEVIEELQKVAADSIRIEGDQLVLKHLYAERMMTPLNLYIQRCSETELADVLNDYGYAIKDLAAANIFPGDMLLKNFGVTRHGRVVFYD